MDQKFRIGDEVVIVIPNRKVDSDFMNFMEPYIGKTAVIEKVEYEPHDNNILPDYCCTINLGCKREKLFEDWLELVDKTEVSFDESQLMSLL